MYYIFGWCYIFGCDNAHVAQVNRGLNWAYFMFNNGFPKYFRYAQKTAFTFETIIEFSAAIRNIYAQLVLINRRLTSTYIMLIWMLLWDPLTYLFHRGTRVLDIKVSGATARWPFTDSAVACSLLLLLLVNRCNNYYGPFFYWTPLSLMEMKWTFLCNPHDFFRHIDLIFLFFTSWK